MVTRDREEDLRPFRLDGSDDGWLDDLALALEPPELGPLGEYQIVEEVARGGQGVVYRAVQTSTGRELALKRLIDGRFAGDAARRRFEREIEAAARLRHPGIVTVLGYEQVDGAPLLAMGWVDGQRLDRWRSSFDRRDADLARVLRCFLRVCEAVEHAHRAGVLHLDLKPSNILVDADDQPVVLDFGLALVQREDATHTATGDFLGTLAYASPEQLRGVRAGLDVRSDVYSLGVLLYELVSGELPFEFDSGVGPALASQASGRYRRLAGRRLGLGRLQTRELDAILARALAPAPADRYPSSAALTDDVRRAIDGRPVAAHPPSLAYELRKFVAAHRAACLWATVALLALLGSGAALVRANRELERERAREEQSRLEAQAAEATALDEAAARADLLQFLFGDLFEERLTVDKDGSLSIADLVDAASEYAPERFADRPLVEAELRSMLGDVNRTIGRFEESERELVKAIELFGPDDPRVAGLRIELGLSLAVQGRLVEAEALLFEGLERADRLDAATHCSALNGIGQVQVRTGRAAEAIAAHREALAIARDHGLAMDEVQGLTGLGVALAQTRDYEGARAAYEAGLALANEHCDEDCGRSAYLKGLLGDLMQFLGHYERALELGREALDNTIAIHGRSHPDTVTCLGDVGELLSQVGDIDGAEVLLVEAVERAVEIRGAESPITDVHRLRLHRNRLLRGELGANLDAIVAIVERFSPPAGIGGRWLTRASDTELTAAYIAGDAARVAALEAAAVAANPDWGRGRALFSARLLYAQFLHGAGEAAALRALLEPGFRELAESDGVDAEFLRREHRRSLAFLDPGGVGVPWLDAVVDPLVAAAAASED